MGEMVDALDMQDSDLSCMAVPFDERMKMAVDYVYEEKRAASVKRLLQRAKLRFPDAEMGEMIYDGRGIDGGVQADAMCDRLIHGAVRIDLGDVNVRKLLAHRDDSAV